MQHPITIRYVDGDELIHTDEHPFCSDCSCPCHDIQDGQYYELIARPLLDGLMTAEEANRLYFGDNPLDSLSHDDIDQVEAYRREYEQQAQERNATQQCSDGSWW